MQFDDTRIVSGSSDKSIKVSPLHVRHWQTFCYKMLSNLACHSIVCDSSVPRERVMMRIGMHSLSVQFLTYLYIYEKPFIYYICVFVSKILRVGGCI